jgi:aspartyl protease family protein
LKITHLLIFSIFFVEGFCQDLTLQETVNYINKKLEDNSIGYNLYHIEVTYGGYLTIYYYNNPSNSSCQLDVKRFLIENANVDYQSTWLIYPQGTIGFSGMKSVKEGSDDCNSRAVNLTEKYSFFSPYIKFSNDELIHESLYNAFTHLFNLVKSDPKYFAGTDPKDPFVGNPTSSDKITTGITSNVIKLEKTSGGLYTIPVVLNSVLKISMIYDSGASDVMISPDVALTLIRTGTLKESDYIGTQTYTFADGSHAKSKRIIIRELQIGNQTIENVEASISNSINAPMLLGQSVLMRFGKIMIDNSSNILYIQK